MFRRTYIYSLFLLLFITGSLSFLEVPVEGRLAHPILFLVYFSLRLRFISEGMQWLSGGILSQISMCTGSAQQCLSLLSLISLFPLVWLASPVSGQT